MEKRSKLDRLLKKTTGLKLQAEVEFQTPHLSPSLKRRTPSQSPSQRLAINPSSPERTPVSSKRDPLQGIEPNSHGSLRKHTPLSTTTDPWSPAATNTVFNTLSGKKRPGRNTNSLSPQRQTPASKERLLPTEGSFASRKQNALPPVHTPRNLLKNLGGRISLPSLNAENSNPQLPEMIERTASLPANPGAGWKALMRAHKTANQFKKAVDLKTQDSSLGRRKSYMMETGQKGIDASKHIRLERGRLLPFSDIKAYKDYFDEIDADGNGVVTVEEVETHRRNKLWENRDFEGILYGLHKDFNFEEMLAKAYPTYSKRDIKTCADAVKTKVVQTRCLDDNASREKPCFLNDLDEVEQYWSSYASEDDILTLSSFQEFLTTLGDDRGRLAVQSTFKMAANPRTGLMRKREFALFWINMFREPDDAAKWEDIADDYRVMCGDD